VRCQRLGAQVTISYRKAEFNPDVIKFWLLPEIRGMVRDGRVKFCRGRYRSRFAEEACGSQKLVMMVERSPVRP